MTCKVFLGLGGFNFEICNLRKIISVGTRQSDVMFHADNDSLHNIWILEMKKKVMIPFNKGSIQDLTVHLSDDLKK